MPRMASLAATAALIIGVTMWAWFSSISPTRSQPALEKVISDAILHSQPAADSGIAIAVIKDGALYYSGGFGFRDRGMSAKVDANTFFGIGSTTKAFTSMAISMLAEDKPAFRLDVPIKQYFPDFAMKDPEATVKMTLKHVLSQTTGLPRHDALWYLGPFTRSQLLYRLQYLEPYPAAFGNSFTYNNMMYMMAGHVLESVAGLTWKQFVKTRILDPLNMSESNFSIGELSSMANYAKGYKGMKELPLKDVENIGPAAEINSSVLEMTNWVLLLLNHGVASNGTRLIAVSDLERMYTPVIQLPGGSGTAYGLGWFVDKLQDKRHVYHPGDTDGYSAYVSFMPDDGLAVIALTNQHASSFPDKVATRIYEFLLSGSGMDRAHLSRGLAQISSAQQEIDAHALSVPVPHASLSDYTGMYSHPGYGDIAVSSAANDYISYYQNNWLLRQRADGTFYFDLHAFGTDFQPRVFFNRTSAGKVDSLGIRFEPTIDPIRFMKR